MHIVFICNRKVRIKAFFRIEINLYDDNIIYYYRRVRYNTFYILYKNCCK